MASLVLYGSTVADSTLTSACDLASSSGGAEVTATSSWGSGNTGELRSQGGTFLGYTSIPAPTGNGWLFNPGAGTFAAGNWSATFAHSTTVPDPGATDFTIRFFNYEDGLYTLLGSISITGNTATTGRKVFTFPATAMASLFIDTPDFLYVDLWEHDAGGLTADGTLYLSSSSTAGVVNDLQITTPDFAPGGGSGRIDPTIFGSAIADTTLTTACGVAPTTGGVETSKNTVYTGGSGNFGEVYSQGNAAANAVTVIPAAPTGHGWVYRPGASTFLAGNWSAVITAATQDNLGTWAFRVFSNIGGVYTLVGTLTAPITGVTKTTYTFAAVSFPAVILGASDFFYFDLWYQDTGGPGAQTVTIYESTTATFGVASDMQITTSLLVPTIATPFVKPYVHFSIPRALGGTIIPLVINPPVIYTPRALGSTLLDDSRIFIPRALGGTYVQDDPTLLWVPRALGGTTQVQTGISLTSTMNGTGTLSETFSLTTSLTDTIVGAGTLVPTLAAKYAIPTTTLVGTGTFIPAAFTEKTALTVTMSGTGILIPTISATLALPSTTFSGTGTLTPTLAATTALSVTMSGVGVLLPTLGATLALPSTALSGVGTLTATLTDTTALAATLTGTGTLVSTISLATALTATMSGIGTLVPTLSIGNTVALAVTETGSGTLVPTLSSATALSVTMQGTGTLGPALSANVTLPTTTFSGVGTLSGTYTESTALSSTLQGVGTLVPVLTAKLTLPSTILPGAGVLAVTLTATTALAQTLTGTGTLLPTISLATSLAVTVSGTGTLVPTLSIGNTVTLSATMAGAGTFVPTPAYKTALAITIAGAGTLIPTLSANVTLSTTTFSGTGTLSGTFTESTALSLTTNGTGTLSGAMAARTALSLVCAASGILVATPSASTALSVTLAGLGILTGTIIKRSTRNAMGRVWIIVQGQVQYHAMGRVTIRARSTYNAQGRVSIALSQVDVVFALADNSAQWDVADNTMTVGVGYNTSDFKI